MALAGNVTQSLHAWNHNAISCSWMVVTLERNIHRLNIKKVQKQEKKNIKNVKQYRGGIPKHANKVGMM